MGQRLRPLLLSGGAVAQLVVGPLVGLQDGIEEALLGFDLLVGDVLNSREVFAEGLLSALALLVLVHLVLPGTKALLTMLENHQKLQ